MVGFLFPFFLWGFLFPIFSWVSNFLFFFGFSIFLLARICSRWKKKDGTRDKGTPILPRPRVRGAGRCRARRQADLSFRAVRFHKTFFQLKTRRSMILVLADPYLRGSDNFTRFSCFIVIWDPEYYRQSRQSSIGIGGFGPRLSHYSHTHGSEHDSSKFPVSLHGPIKRGAPPSVRSADARVSVG